MNPKKNMQTIIVLRDSVSLALAVWATHAVFTGDVASMKFMLYPFMVFFVLDFYLQTKFDLILHHVIGLVLCFYGIVVPLPTNILTMVLYTEVSTILLVAMIYCPKPYLSMVKVLFMLVFYVTRIDNYVEKLLQHNAYNLPNYWILLSSLWALFALNFYWFSLMLKKVPATLRPCFYVFTFGSLFLKFFYYQ